MGKIKRCGLDLLSDPRICSFIHVHRAIRSRCGPELAALRTTLEADPIVALSVRYLVRAVEDGHVSMALMPVY